MKQVKHITYAIRKFGELQSKYDFGMTIEESTGFCVRLEKDGRCHLVSGADLGLNSSASQRVSADKAFTDFFLNRDGIGTIRTTQLHGVSELEKLSLDFPVILKPNKSQSGNGVLLVRNREDAIEVFPYVQRFSQIVLAQEYIDKKEFRLVVFDGRMYFCYQRTPFAVQGDGRKSIADFLEEKNEELGEMHRIDSDDFRLIFNLKANNLALSSVPDRGRQVKLFINSNLKCGGSWRDVTGQVNPGYVDIANRCAKSVGLRIAGIDLFADSIEEFDPEYRIIEVNSRPGFEYIKGQRSMTDGFFEDVTQAIVSERLSR